MTAALLIAAPASCQGKTTVAAALARLHARQGARVRCFKCGPDFIDPMWLQLASGHPVDPLDLWLLGEADCARRLAAAAVQADLVVIEGVMGLFDGQPSAADLARRFDIPVLAVIDASAMAATFAAMAHGLQTWQPGLRWAGVLANRVAGERHAAMLRSALREPAHWQGWLPRDAQLALPERHLGLTMPSDATEALRTLDAAADALRRTPLGQRRLSDWPAWTPPYVPSSGGLPPPLRGHSFHWSRFETPLLPAGYTQPMAHVEGGGEPVYERGSLRASWFHPWFPSSPRLVARLFGSATAAGHA